MSERFKEHAWKVCVRLTAYRGFESLSLRQFAPSAQEESKKLLSSKKPFALKIIKTDFFTLYAENCAKKSH